MMRKAEFGELMAEMGLLEEQSDVLEKDKEQPAASVEKGSEHEVKSENKKPYVFLGRTSRAEYAGRAERTERPERSGRTERTERSERQTYTNGGLYSGRRNTYGQHSENYQRNENSQCNENGQRGEECISVTTVISVGTVANGWMFTRKNEYIQSNEEKRNPRLWSVRQRHDGEWYFGSDPGRVWIYPL